MKTFRQVGATVYLYSNADFDVCLGSMSAEKLTMIFLDALIVQNNLDVTQQRATTIYEGRNGEGDEHIIYELLMENRKVAAIKYYRNVIKGIGLREAVEVINEVLHMIYAANSREAAESGDFVKRGPTLKSFNGLYKSDEARLDSIIPNKNS